MDKKENNFFNKKILIYGFGKSGSSSYKFLKKSNKISVYDDKKKGNFFSKKKTIDKINFDYIVISPGINTLKCKLKKLLKFNRRKIITDLDIFYYHYFKNFNITITGTNGKSTTAKILYDVLKRKKKDVRLVGNIGNPILLEKNITSKTIFIIEASSYQIEYTKNFIADFAAIINITPDHLERHGTFSNYVNAKLKLLKNQTKKGYSFLNLKNKNFEKKIKKLKIKSKIIKIDINLIKKELPYINNNYFLTDGNLENLSFVMAIINKLKIKKKYLFKVLNKFKGLKFRQQIIFESKKLQLINDSKATSFSSSTNILKSLNHAYWILGGIPKKGDKFLMKKKDCKNFKAYIFGQNKFFFIKELKDKIIYECFNNLNEAVKKVIKDLDLKRKIYEKKTILFSPSAASFDNYKNFEERGKKFNDLIKKIKLQKIIDDK